jgi:oligopeptidase B
MRTVFSKMHYIGMFSLLIVTLLITSCDTQRRPTGVEPPVAEERPVELTLHGDTRIDNYYWLNDREDPEVIAYIEAENEYLNTMMAHTERLQDRLYNEMRGRVKEDDQSVPYKLDDYYYYTRYEEGSEYPIYCRRYESMDAEEEIIVNANELAEGHTFFMLSGLTVSPDHRLAAFGVDTVGRRFYTIMLKDLGTGEMLDTRIPNVTGNIVWANDNTTVFYSRQDPQTLRSYQIYRYELGQPVGSAAVVYEEKDETFYLWVGKTKSRQYIVVTSGSINSTEQRFVNADRPRDTFRVVQPRERDHEYSISHAGDLFYIRTNLDAPNFRLMTTPVNRTQKANWREYIPHREDVLLERVELFEDFIVVGERKEGLTNIRIIDRETQDEHYLDFGEPAYTAYIDNNPEYATTLLRYGYSSLTTPNSTYDYDMATRERELLKQTEVLGDFSPDNYITERLYAPAEDGTQIPVSLVYRKGFKKDGSHPMLVYGYGSYGASMNPFFSSNRLSLLDRGFVYAIAHIRGGQEMGRHWYEDGKLLNKINTFTDFIACTEFLQSEGFSTPEKTFAQGGSGGGLLMGAVVNMRPDLYNGVIAAVPFVDVITTMLDDSIPLTTQEYDEWGNPNDPEYYEYILSYSPYDNVVDREYPNMLITSGLHDSQVQYWEPTKWTAKLRDHNTGDGIILLYTNMEAGHGGASGRFQGLRETALQYAFILDLAGIRR